MNELVPANSTVSFGLPLDCVSDNPASARAVIESAAEGLRIAAAASVYYRFVLGSQLLVIRENGLWREPSLQCRELHGPGSWDGWISEHFPEMSRMSRRTAFGAMQIAGSSALRSLGEPGLRNFETLANAILLARVEKQRGEKTAKGLLVEASKLSMEAFREKAGAPVGRGQTSTVTDSPASARHLDRISRRLKDADEGALEQLAAKIDEDVAAVAGDNPEDIVTFLLAAIEHELEQMLEQ